jgi:cysteine desulfurase
MAELGAVCRERGVVFHSDAVQWFGKEPFADIGRFNANLVSVCAHKIHGPKGAGLLFIQSPLHPDPVFWGGAQEIERRAGTENLPAIIGLVTALEKLVSPPVFDRVRLKPLADKLVSAIENMDGCEMVSPRENSLANTVAFAVRGADGMALLAGLDLEGICASSGSACSAGSLEPSHVLAALGRRDAAGSLIRFSLGRDSTLAEVDFVRSVLPEVIQHARRARPPRGFSFPPD